MKKLFAYICLLFIAHTSYSQEFLIRDETFTWEGEEHSYFGGNGFHWWSDYSKYPSNWVSPHNYYQGRIYYRYEVISQPTTKPFKLMFLIWQFQEDGQHRETGDEKVPVSGDAGAVTEYNTAPAPSAWWSYYEEEDKKVDFTKIGQYSNTGDNRMGLALWSDGGCIPSYWGGGSSDFYNSRKPDYFPMKIRITIVAVAEGNNFSGWGNYVTGGGSGGGNTNDDITFSIDFVNEKTSQVVPSYYEYSADQTSWTAGAGNKLDLTPGENVYFRKTGSTTIQTLTVPDRQAQQTVTVSFQTEKTNENIASGIEYSPNSNFSGATSGNGSKAPLTPGTNLYFRKKATGSAFRSAGKLLTVPQRPSAPVFSIDFIAEKTNEIVPNTVEYSSVSTFTSNTSGNGTKTTLNPGSQLYFRKKYTASAFAGHSQKLLIPQRPMVTSDAGDTVNLKPFTVTVKFVSTVTGFVSSDIKVSNATVKSLSGSYKATIEPSALGIVNIQIPANAVAEGNFASTGINVYYKKSTGLETIPENTLNTLYPNPAKEYFVIENKTGSRGNYHVNIFNANGGKVLAESYQSSEQRIDIQTLPKGMYFVEINEGNNMSRRKLIKL